jgi:excisionase family DNA binding protein
LVFDNKSQGMTTTAIPDHDSVAPLWTTKGVARFLGCSERQIPRLREEGLPAVRVGGLIRFVPDRVMAWLNSRDERARQLADIGANNGEDADEISASDAFKEFPPLP